MPPAAQTYLYTSSADVEALLSAEGVEGWLDDDFSGANSATEITYLTTYAVNYATSRVNLYVGGKYAPSQLINSWTANYWATGLAACWLAKRRANVVPTSLTALCQEIMDELKEVAIGDLIIPDIAQREGDWPSWSNMRKDIRFQVKQLRVQRPLSEDTPTDYVQKVDLPAEYTGEQ